jgi:DUF2075 family protein
MCAEAETWGWASSVGRFLSTPPIVILQALADHHTRLFGFRAAGAQTEAWRAEEAATRGALGLCLATDETIANRWSVVFEYELPLEGGRRPDVVVLAGGAMAVLEFKSNALPAQADIDQVRAYARDLADYHEASHGRLTSTILVMAGAAPGFARELDGTAITSPEQIHSYLLAVADEGDSNLVTWLDAPYRPLPTLVEAARRLFRDDPPPHVIYALSTGIPDTVELLGRLVEDAARDGTRILALITGVPGSGKTLAGLRLVYERTETVGRATFLSGNGPLVAVLQDALKSRAFVRDLHAFIRTYAMATRTRVPGEHVIVFDEAQRAWDHDYMLAKRNVAASEPELLVQIGERLDSWASLVGLVGEGQEIHSGEEAGLGQWREALLPPKAKEAWTVHCPPRLEPDFAGLAVRTHERLDLTVSLRSRRAAELHDWVRHLLAGSVPLAARLALRIQGSTAVFPMYITRELDEARGYVRSVCEEAPQKTFGLLASSHAKVLPRYGVNNGFMATSRMNVARWYNGPRDDPLACTALSQPVTEFGCQGLELDLPIVCWGDDARWTGGTWHLTPVRRKYRQTSPDELLRNAYRVLLTRGRDGLVVFLPDDPLLDETEHILLAAGIKPLPAVLDLAVEA